MSEVRPLSEIRPGESGVLASFSERTRNLLRLQELGLTPGQRVEVVRISPLGDPMEIRLIGFDLCLRKSEAQCIHVRCE